MDSHGERSMEVLQGIVYHRSQGLYSLRMDDGREVTCAASSKLRKKMEHWFGLSDRTNVHTAVKSIETLDSVDPIAIGDQVLFRLPEPESIGMIMDVLPRRNELSRMAAGPVPVEQVIVANVDQVILVFRFAIKPKVESAGSLSWPQPNRQISRRWSASRNGISSARRTEWMRSWSCIRVWVYPVLMTSVVEKLGIDALRSADGG